MLTNADLAMTKPVTLTLAPGATKSYAVDGKIMAALNNTVVAKGTPAFADGTYIPDLNPVTASDPSAVGMLPSIPSIKIDNTVMTGHNGVTKCGTSVEKVTGMYGDFVEYCFNVTNTGNTYLDKVTIADGMLSSFTTCLGQILAPGQTKTISVPSDLLSSKINTATVTANPVDVVGNAIPGLTPVTASDPSEVALLVFKPSIVIENTVRIRYQTWHQFPMNRILLVLLIFFRFRFILEKMVANNAALRLRLNTSRTSTAQLSRIASR
jgi:archaellum component FlaF (FlaF/FlaG flagellin family)